MPEYLRESWYVIVIVAIGVVATAVTYAPMVRARVRAHISPRQYLAKAALIAFCVGAVVGVVFVPFVEVDSVLFVIAGLVVLGVLFGWLLMFENDAVRFSGWLRLQGPVELDAERMARPVPHSWMLTALFLVVGLLGGICVRLLLLASA